MLTGVILAGGQSSRMGGQDKGLQLLAGEPLYKHVLTRFLPQVDEVIISANRNIASYRRSGLRTIRDQYEGFAGPLAGIHAGLQAAKSEWVVCVPCDVPALPLDLVTRLWAGKSDAPAAYATDGVRSHPTLLLLHTRVSGMLEDYLRQGDRKLMLFLERINARPVSFADQADAFRNFNTPEDLKQWSVT
ncbi:molybdenum cofactor guanylyltransferase MobA [Affinibrenneria salicis]|uniref:Molybdenum cofactor guanylyltransferase n=1 Tax=Affinibrenneria salicis TaxID=2590031 RepID=A0A5J5FVJ0_9GAMM|nr:molybdenum cofactor guanylyltransferase MobA [Affinibrenneria salicis]KAA8997427.1 molybdenum cofactor guanylyltransferase MobA [Affinibrenneria salicis]